MVIYIFYSSLIALILMLLSKIVEIKVDNFNFWSNFSKRTDFFIDKIIDSVYKRVRLYRKIAYLFVFEFLPSYMYENTVKLKDFIYKKYYASADSLRANKKILRSNGSVSAFLQDISKESKETLNNMEETVVSNNIDLKQESFGQEKTEKNQIDL